MIRISARPRLATVFIAPLASIVACSPSVPTNGVTPPSATAAAMPPATAPGTDAPMPSGAPTFGDGAPNGADVPGKPDTPTTVTTLLDSTPPIGMPAAPTGPALQPVGIDCRRVLPCHASLDDDAIVLTLDSISHDEASGTLNVAYDMVAGRDTRVEWDVPGSARDGELALRGRLVNAKPVDKASPSTALVASTSVEVVENFDVSDEGPLGPVVHYRLTVVEGETMRAVRYDNVPLASIADEPPVAVSDCEQSLPCRWKSPDRKATVTLVLAEQLPDTGEVVLIYYAEVSDTTYVTVGQETRAMGSDGTPLIPNLHSLNDVAVAEPLELTLSGGTSNRGIQDFAASESVSIDALELDFDIRGGSQPISPSFSNVPIAR